MAHTQTHSDRLVDALTEREQEILVCLAEELTNREIANRLHLAERTVRWYNSQIYSKLGVKNRGEAAELATTLGLLHPENVTTLVKHNLPAQTTRFIGRERELADLARLFSDEHVRLITILAPGGMGKTRLAQEIARRTLAAFPDGVTFVPLAPIDSADHILSTIGENIDALQSFSDADLDEQLKNYLRKRQMLLVLDSFEHVLSGASVIAELLQAAPDIKILVTSREKLNLSGEQVFALGGLAFPDEKTVEDRLEYSGVKLFLQHAHLARLDFEVGDENFEHLGRICRLVAGMPLGLVLAAAWVEVLSLQEIADEISQGLEFLAAEKRDLPERQRSIQAVFQTSWNRLSTGDQQSFMKMAVFRGGFTRQAAQAVAGANVQILQQLVSKALVSLNATGRYEIHELLRQYAHEHLASSGTLKSTQEAHSHYFLALLAGLEPDIKGRSQAEAWHEITLNFVNIRLAWHWALAANRFDWLGNALECFKVYVWYLDTRGVLDHSDLFRDPGLTLLNSGQHPLMCARLLTADALLLSTVRAVNNKLDSELLRWALDIAHRHEEQSQIAICLWTLGLDSYLAQDYEDAFDYFSESLAHLRVLGDTFYAGWALQWMGSCTRQLKGIEDSHCFFQESLELRQLAGDRVGEYTLRTNFGINSILVGALAEAEVEFRDIDKRFPEAGQPGDLVASFLGWIAALSGNPLSAHEYSEKAHKTANDAQFRPYISHALSLQALLDALEESYTSSLHAGLEAKEVISISYYIFFADWAISLAYCGLGDYTAARTSTHEALTYAYTVKGEGAMTWCLPVVASLLEQENQPDRAVEVLALAYHHPASATGWQDNWPLLTRLRDSLKETVGPEDYQVLWEHGQTLDLYHVVAEWLAAHN